MGTSVKVEFPHCEMVFDLFDNDFTQRWAMIFQHDLTFRNLKFNNDGNFFGSGLYSENDLLQKMQACVDTVNAFKPGTIQSRVFKGMAYTDLMLLHGDFERLESDPEYLEPREALRLLNVYIHQYESLGTRPLTHADIVPEDVSRYKFKDDDYFLFERNHLRGHIYLAYGVTGIPPFCAYRERSLQVPVPQRNMTAGFSIFFEDSIFNVDEDHMRRWFNEKWNMDALDPKSSIGNIPLGRLREMGRIGEFAKSILKDPRVLRVSLDPVPEISKFDERIERLPIEIEDPSRGGVSYA